MWSIHASYFCRPADGDTIAGGVTSFSSEGKHWEVVKNEQVGDQKFQYPLLLCVLGSGGGGIKVGYH